MGVKESKGAKRILERKPFLQAQPLLQIAPLPKKRGTEKARRELRIHPEIYPVSVVETACRLIDPRDFEVVWEPEESAGHIIVRISAKSYEHDAEALEYYFYRKLILASTSHHSQQTHADIRTLFMQTAHNVTRQTWQALGWDDGVTAPTTEAKEAGEPNENPQPTEFNNISYVVDETQQKLIVYVSTGEYVLPDVLSAVNDMRRIGWDVEVDARAIPVRVEVRLKKGDVKKVVTLFYEGLESAGARNARPAASEDSDGHEDTHRPPEGTAGDKVDVDVSHEIFPQPTIQLAALLVLDRLHIKIDGEAAGRIRVTLKPKSPTSIGNVESVFHEALIQASLDEYKLASYEPIRAYFLKRALSFSAVPEMAPLTSFFPMPPRHAQALDYQMSVSGPEIHLSVSPREAARIPLFAVAQRLRMSGTFVFKAEGPDGIRVHIRPKANLQIRDVKKDLHRELQRELHTC